MAVNEILKQPKFCWWCYSESVTRFARELPSRTLREAVLAAAQEHRRDGGLIPTLHEHARHPGARPAVRRHRLMLAEAEAMDEAQAAS